MGIFSKTGGFLVYLKDKAAARRARIRRELELRRLARIRKKKYPKYRYCKNCGTELQGMYCHHCGQYALDTEQPFWKYVLQYFENVYQFDSKVWVTLAMLFRRPGFLTTEFNAGKIASYVHPMRLLMFITVLFFLFFFTFLNGKVDSMIEKENTGLAVGEKVDWDEIYDESGTVIRDTCMAIIADSAIVDAYAGLLKVEESVKGEDGMDTLLVSMPSGIAEAFIPVDDTLRNGYPLVEEAANPNFERKILFKERVIGAASSYAPMVALLLTPVLALLMMWFYRKFRMGYMSHFVFSLHLASFFYIVFAVYITVGELWQYGGLPWYVFSLSLLVYMVVASHRVYAGTGWVKAFLKTILVALVYGFTVGVVLVSLLVWLFYSEVGVLHPDRISVL